MTSVGDSNSRDIPQPTRSKRSDGPSTVMADAAELESWIDTLETALDKAKAFAQEARASLKMLREQRESARPFLEPSTLTVREFYGEGKSGSRPLSYFDADAIFLHV
ncbi:hypothetical protein POX_f08436 [Penicillium oxalicum]|uniref:hypothetical protein n=1 Tax=Penicillium oxalicum TaxID=69781 RepID=UPI0020B78E89|nr:hypothetical protein POX_f08436 [Penicillium oxalicum]KAI2788051.1 hypothetical protein POX_f08436 [Penicillium oxalicum]